VSSPLLLCIVLYSICSLHYVYSTTYTVYVGLSSQDSELDLNGAPKWNIFKYYPSTLDVMQGDTIEYQFQSTEPHTLTYLNNNIQLATANSSLDLPIPSNIQQTNSFIFDGQTEFSSGFLNWQANRFVLNITAPIGQYLLFCAIHYNMHFNLNVVQSITNGQTSVSINTAALTARQNDLMILQQALVNPQLVTANLNEIDWAFGNASFQVDANGMNTHWIVTVGYSIPSLNATSSRPYPIRSNIKVGDTITFDVCTYIYIHIYVCL
jgi:plastocyanin